MKELIIDVSQLDIEELLYGTVCQIVWMKLSHCSCLKENWNDFCWTEIYWLYVVEHINSVILLLLNNMKGHHIHYECT